MTTLNAPGFSITLLNLTRSSKMVPASSAKLLEFLDASHSASAWPGGNPHVAYDATLAKRSLEEKCVAAPTPSPVHNEDASITLKGTS